METAIFIALRFATTLAWVCFVSWAISRLAFEDELPPRRAGLTALSGLATAYGVAVLLTLIIPEYMPDSLYLPRYNVRDFGIASLFYLPAALVDYLLLRAAFRKAWISGDEVAGTFD